MADDNQSERPIHIQGTANINEATGSEATGVKIERVTGNIHVHGDTTPPPSFRSVALVGVLALLGAVLVNIATSQLPESWTPYLWLAWPLALLVTAISIWVAYRQSRSGGSNVALGISLNQRNRRVMLAKVKAIWIDGLLEQSLAKELRIALNLTEQPGAVDLPLNALVQELNRPPRQLPTGTPIIEVFEQMGGALLILGAPGAGKTTLLLELARDLIVRAEQDEGHPIPVVFNLSSWAEKRRPLKEWLVEELKTKYDVPRKLAHMWMDADAVLPLLDGLDEVAEAQREGCVDAINDFRQKDGGLVRIVVCSRSKEYKVLTTKLRVQSAIVVHMLSGQQVDDYLEHAGEQAAGIRTALCEDVKLQRMLRTPLMLSIATLAYAGTSPTAIYTTGSVKTRRQQLFDAYIKKMFRRRSKEMHYSQQQTTSSLSWLAAQMVAHNLTVYYIEQLQPDWLPPEQKSDYSRRIRLFFGLGVGLIVGLGGGLIFGLGGGLTLALIFGLPFGLMGGMFGGILVAQRGRLGNGPDVDLGRRLFENIQAIEVLGWSWKRGLSMLVVGLIIGAIGGLIVGLFVGLSGGLIVGLVYGLIVGLVTGLSPTELPVKATPNQGIRRSLRSWLGVGLGVGLFSGLVGALVFFGLVTGPGGGPLGTLVSRLVSGPLGGLVYGLVGGLVGGLVVGLVVGLDYGGRAVLQHYALRWLLYRNGSLPLRLVPFLDYCAERIFLRKVGGGYIFVHRLLMEHFASLYSEQMPTEPVEAQQSSS